MLLHDICVEAFLHLFCNDWPSSIDHYSTAHERNITKFRTVMQSYSLSVVFIFYSRPRIRRRRISRISSESKFARSPDFFPVKIRLTCKSNFV
jgi:hypothetical protein